MKYNPLVLLFVLCFGSCAISDTDVMPTDTNNIQAAGLVPAPTPAATSLYGKWNLIPALPADTATGRLPYLHFDSAALKINGNTGCNNFGGTYQLSSDNLSFGKNMMSTKMACPGYNEASFLQNLLRVNKYAIKGDTLELKVDATPLSYWLKTK